MHEQMYVEVLTPRRLRSRYPLVLIHGAAQTATNWMGTPDGRPGWADYFVGQGYTVYMVDQPARGRSPWLPEVDGQLATFTADQIEARFTAPQASHLWPRAKMHSQWPGTGRIGDARSPEEELMTCKTSAVAVSRASASSRSALLAAS